MQRAELLHATEATAHTLGCGTHLAMGTCVMQSGESEKVIPGSHATHGWMGNGEGLGRGVEGALERGVGLRKGQGRWEGRKEEGGTGQWVQGKG